MPKKPNIESVARATVIEINGSSVLIEPLEGEWERMREDRIHINIGDLEDVGVEARRGLFEKVIKLFF